MEWKPIEECQDEDKEFLITGFNRNIERNGRWMAVAKMYDGEWFSVDNPEQNYYPPTHFMVIEWPKAKVSE